jgi:hypothetical protein
MARSSLYSFQRWLISLPEYNIYALRDSGDELLAQGDHASAFVVELYSPSPSTPPAPSATPKPTEIPTTSPTNPLTILPTIEPTIEPSLRPTTTQPVAPPVRPNTPTLVKVDIIIDENPEDVGWKIQEFTDQNATIRLTEPGFYTKTGTFSSLVVLDSAIIHVFIMLDASGEGTCKFSLFHSFCRRRSR